MKVEIYEKENILEFLKKSLSEIFLFSFLSDFSMKTKFGGYIAIAVGVTIVIGFFGIQNGEIEDKNTIFHVTLANPENYEDGIFTDSFEIEEGTYAYRFVPNGDSPQILTISLNGESIRYLENFILKGTPHETGFSTYYTWEYSGNIGIIITQKQEVKITIDPNGNLLGPVSVYIIKQ
jgi:hypothetical protein